MAIRQTILAEKDCYRIDAINHIVSNGINTQVEMTKGDNIQVDFRADGIMLPRNITWEDGREYEIDSIQ